MKYLLAEGDSLYSRKIRSVSIFQLLKDLLSQDNFITMHIVIA